MNLTWLDDFLALAATGNFSRAADERHMTQPAFGRRIRALEEWLGVVLFDRSAHPPALTEAGEWFRSVAQELLGRVARVPEEARAVASARSATLRIAATHALSFTFLPGWLRALESRLAAVSPLQLMSDTMQQCEALMLQGRAQFLLCHAHSQVPNRLDAAAYRSVSVGTDALLPVSAADAAGQPRFALSAGGRPAAGRSPSVRAGGAPAARSSAAAARAGTPSPTSEPGRPPVPLLVYSAESGIGRLVRTLRGAALQGAHAKPALTAHLASVLKTMVLDGRGVAWLPRSLIAEEMAAGRLVAAGDASWAIEVEIRLFRQAATAAPAAEAFWRTAVAESTGGGDA